MTEHEKPDLSKIEPIGRPLDADHDAEPVGKVAVGTGTPPAVGIADEVVQRDRRDEPITSPETEAQLEELRRG